MSADQGDLDRSVEDVALQYFARGRSGDMSAADALERDAWLAADDQHLDAYRAVKSAWAEADNLHSDPSILVMREEALGALTKHRKRRVVRRVLVGSAFVGGALVALLMAGSSWMNQRGDEAAVALIAQTEARSYATRTGEVKSIALADGTLAILDSQSQIRTHIGATGTRRIELLEGRAQFAVAKNPSRKFTVQVGAAVVTALGTRFDVYRHPEGLEVYLIEGRLRVEPPKGSAGRTTSDERTVEMVSGNRLAIRKGGWHLTNEVAEPEIEWTKGQLTFDDAPIDLIVAELNRYTQDKITLVEDLRNPPRLSAVIRTSDPLMFLQAVDAMGIGHSRQTASGHQIVLKEK